MDTMNYRTHDDHVLSCLALGDIYREGLYHVEPDPAKAWAYYEEGSKLNSVKCYERMHEMLRCNEYVPETEDIQETMDLCALYGARLHSKLLIVEAVHAYQHGRLEQFASEMEEYHIPAYEAIPDDEPLDDDDEWLDDDGRYDAWA